MPTHTLRYALACGIALATAFVNAQPTAAGPYMTGIGLTNPRFDLRFTNFTWPFMVGTGYAHGIGDSTDNGAVLRLGIGLIHFEGDDSLASPDVMFALDCVVHLGDADYATYGGSYLRGVGPLLVGGGASVAARGSDDRADLGLGVVLSPELSLPLRIHVHDKFTPTVVVFARLDVVAFGRNDYDDQVLLGATLALW